MPCKLPVERFITGVVYTFYRLLHVSLLPYSRPTAIVLSESNQQHLVLNIQDVGQ